MESQLFWRDITRRLRAVARSVILGSGVMALSEDEDLTQDTLIDLQAFVARRREEDPDLDAAALREEALTFGKRCLKNNFLDTIRKRRRRAEFDAAVTLGSNEAQGFLDVGFRRTDMPEEVASALDLIEAMRAKTRSAVNNRLLTACATIVRTGIRATPDTLRDLSGVQDLHKFRAFVRNAGDLPSIVGVGHDDE